MQHAAGWWWPVGAAMLGLALGGMASLVTRRFLSRECSTAGSWWLGAVLTAAVLGLLGWRDAARGELAVYGVVAVLGVSLAVIDWCEHRLPRVLVCPQLAAAAVGFAVLCLVRADPAPGARALGASLAAAGLFLTLAVLTAGGVGAGDISLAAVVGLVCGWSGWLALAGALLLASALAGVLLLVPGSRRRDEHGVAAVAFGPCLLGGALAMVTMAG